MMMKVGTNKLSLVILVISLVASSTLGAKFEPQEERLSNIVDRHEERKLSTIGITNLYRTDVRTANFIGRQHETTMSGHGGAISGHTPSAVSGHMPVVVPVSAPHAISGTMPHANSAHVPTVCSKSSKKGKGGKGGSKGMSGKGGSKGYHGGSSKTGKSKGKGGSKSCKKSGKGGKGGSKGMSAKGKGGKGSSKGYHGKATKKSSKRGKGGKGSSYGAHGGGAISGSFRAADPSDPAVHGALWEVEAAASPELPERHHHYDEHPDQGSHFGEDAALSPLPEHVHNIHPLADNDSDPTESAFFGDEDAEADEDFQGDSLSNYRTDVASESSHYGEEDAEGEELPGDSLSKFRSGPVDVPDGTKSAFDGDEAAESDLQSDAHSHIHTPATQSSHYGEDDAEGEEFQHHSHIHPIADENANESAFYGDPDAEGGDESDAHKHYHSPGTASSHNGETEAEGEDFPGDSLSHFRPADRR